ncbi:hypothetical protein ES702_00342 [subsurface metagenome]
MSKKKKNKIDGNFTIIEHKLINSEAFKGLSLHAKWLYVEFKIRFYGDNRRNIILTYQEAKNILSENTFIKSRNKLIERGFIDIVKRGGLENQPMIYGLSERWKKYGTKDFIKINIGDILPKIYGTKFKKGHKFMGNRFKKKKHL